MTASQATPTTAPRPSLRSANLLYLVALVAVLVAGSWLQMRHFGWGLLATELIIGVLALLWARLNRLPLRPTFRLRPARPVLLLLAFLMGIGVWFLDAWLGAVTSAILGYDVPAPPGIYPQSLPALLLLAVAFVVAAPLCEELMFRGYLQVVYERFRPLVAIVTVALLFALFHLSLLGFPPRLPVALALGYVAWRSGSLWPGVALHAANNLLAVVVLGIGWRSPTLLAELPVGNLPSAALGLLLLAVGWWLFQRAAGPRPAPALVTTPAARGRLAQSWPLAIALLIVAAVAALEVVAGRFPELLATEPLALSHAPWQAPQALEYDLLHAGGEKVGEARCELSREGDLARTRCELANEPFEFRQASSFWSSTAAARTFDASYQAADMRLLALDDRQQLDEHTVTLQVSPAGDGLRLEVDSTISGQSATDIPPYALVNELWPLQLSALPFAAGAAYEATLVYPERWDNDLQRNVLTVTGETVVIGGAEPLSVPAGDYLAWRVQVANQTAWYSAEPPHTLLRYDGPMLSWRLTAAE